MKLREALAASGWEEDDLNALPQEHLDQEVDEEA